VQLSSEQIINNLSEAKGTMAEIRSMNEKTIKTFSCHYKS